MDGFRAISFQLSLGERTLPWVLLRKNCFPRILDRFRAIHYVFVTKTYATLVVVAVVVVVVAVVVVAAGVCWYCYCSC